MRLAVENITASRTGLFQIRGRAKRAEDGPEDETELGVVEDGEEMFGGMDMELDVENGNGKSGNEDEDEDEDVMVDLTESEVGGFNDALFGSEIVAGT